MIEIPFIVRLQQGRIFLTTEGLGQAIDPTVNVLVRIANVY